MVYKNYVNYEKKLDRLKKKNSFPTPGIEPGPPAWKAGILTTRPYGRAESDRDSYSNECKVLPAFACGLFHWFRYIKTRSFKWWNIPQIVIDTVS